MTRTMPAGDRKRDRQLGRIRAEPVDERLDAFPAAADGFRRVAADLHRP